MSINDLDHFKKNYYSTELNLKKVELELEYWKKQAEFLKDNNLTREEIVVKIKTEMRLAQRQIGEL